MPNIDIDFFKNLRRESYVDAINYKMSGNLVAGYFGEIDEAFLRAYNFYPIPIVSVDGFIFKYGKVDNSCDAINSTRIYLETQKCPLLFSSEIIVYDETCPIFVHNIKNITDKKFINKNKLEKFLKDKFFDKDKYNLTHKKLIEIDNKIKLLTKTNIDSKLLSYAKFYQRYVFDLDRRIDILDELIKSYKNINANRKVIRLACPYGILDEALGENYDIIESTYEVDFSPNRCAFCDKYIKYEV